MWQASSCAAGLFVSGGLAVVGLALLGVSRLLVRDRRPLARSSRFALRHAVLSLGRPGNQTRVILMSVGLGCFFVLGVRALQTNLLAEFRSSSAPTRRISCSSTSSAIRWTACGGGRAVRHARRRA